MLVEFRVANHRSIRDEQVLGLEAGRIHDQRDPPPSGAPGVGPVLPVTAIYGANASGKSNLIDAIQYMRMAVVGSFQHEPDEPFPRDAFAWDGGSARGSMFECVLVLGDVRYQYGFVVDDVCFREEWLYAYPHGRKQVWFERDATGDSHEAHEYKFGENFGGPNAAVSASTRPNALFLSTAARFEHERLAPIYQWFSQSLRVVAAPSTAERATATQDLERWLWTHLGPVRHQAQSEHSRAHESPNAGYSAERTEALRALLKAADVGIANVRIVEEQSTVDPASGVRRPPRRRRVILLEHAGATESGWLEMRDESHGTQTLMLRAPALIDALASGGTVVVDELETSLHPLLAAHLVRIFNDPATNPRRAQLVFATHDTQLLGTVLGEPALRRDQVWLTEKDGTGGTKLYPLTDYTPRKAENLERGYLQGRYGAIPLLGPLLGSE